MKMNKKGFTLVELLVVLGILVLLAGIGIPQYLNVQQRAEDALRLAKAQAAVTAFLAEVGYDSEGVLPTGEETIPLKDLKGTSKLTGETISFSEHYWNVPEDEEAGDGNVPEDGEDGDGPLDDLVVDHEGKVSFDPERHKADGE